MLCLRKHFQNWICNWRICNEFRVVKKAIPFGVFGKGQLSITVFGSSMLPTIKAGDKIDVKVTNECFLGDVVVFFYNGELLVHRVVKYINGQIYCKGDNSFRLEKITFDNLVGRVVTVNGFPIKPLPNQLISLSYMVHREFCKTGKNIEKTMKSGIYTFYNDTMNDRDSKGLFYQRNVDLTYNYLDDNKVDIEDDNFVIHLEKGDAYIINILKNTKTFDEIQAEINFDYSNIQLKQFLIEMVINKIVYKTKNAYISEISAKTIVVFTTYGYENAICEFD